MTSTGSSDLAAAHRRALRVAVGVICMESGFDRANESCLESLTEMLQSYLTELGRSARTYCELAGRTLPMVTDVGMALTGMGSNVKGLAHYARRRRRFPPLHQDRSKQSQPCKALQASERKPHPSYIPDHLPEFPDPHTYIRTTTNRQQENDYKVIRERAASQKRDVERALTRFIAKTGDTQTLFPGDSNVFPLIACTPSPLPYIDALMPPEHEICDDDEMDDTDTDDQKLATDEGDSAKPEDGETGAPKSPGSARPRVERMKVDAILSDNPFLRKVKKPRLKVKKK
ncbi:transcription initiation factor TFIID subunit 8-like isoform X2 [Patiria miniata]|nr:transcription initiation factor TFIID subunit 8-like isoform X2 [Patiria miniata]XP_038053315.1 transcription initiation factor TFIID subunit 8-like isoform X2 [Patiria miniata]